MSYYRRLIEESEKKRILGMHNTYKSNPRTWVIREAYSAQPGEGYDGGVKACLQNTPLNVAAKLGIDFKKAKQEWGSSGNYNDNIELVKAMCNGWRLGDGRRDSGTGTPTEQKPGEQQGIVKPGGEQPKVGTGQETLTPGGTQGQEGGGSKFIEPIFPGTGTSPINQSGVQTPKAD
jgi:hypothetical protein